MLFELLKGFMRPAYKHSGLLSLYEIVTDGQFLGEVCEMKMKIRITINSSHGFMLTLCLCFSFAHFSRSYSNE